MERYMQIKKIGEGSFGKALLVKRKEDGKQCVVKQICISRMSHKEKEESRKEVQLLSKLKHPNIVTYLESFEGSGNLYIVMDYCEGGDLYQLIVRQRGMHMEESKVLDIFVQCCLAIKYIHDRKILHRDIKTQNIFLTRHHIVKLGDFGIARVLKNTMELARTCIGTPYYLSPEIVENRPYNNKSDIWSLGCVLYELATLKHAFEAGNMKNLVLKICRGSYPPVPPKYSYELRSLVAHCFKRSPSDRPSINTLLKKPIIQQRISKFLSPEEVEEEFSHTVLHRQPKPSRAGVAGRPPSAAAGPVKKIVPAKRHGDLVSVYGVSVAKKPAERKPPSMAPYKRVEKKPANVQGVRSAEKKAVDARERRRKEVLAQEKQYHEHIKKVQKQRWEKQQAANINRAREGGWKNVLGTDEKDKMKKYQPKAEDKVVVKNKRYIEPDEKPDQQPLHAWAEQEHQAHRKNLGAVKKENSEDDEREKKEKARMLDDFWRRKEEAAANKARVSEALAGPRHHNPILDYHENRMKKEKPVVSRPPIHPGARNPQEAEYLRQLEQIRKQNYKDRQIMRGNTPSADRPSSNNKVSVAGDPKVDPDARRRKIQELKEQADRRAAMLKEQLEKRRQQIEKQVEKDRMERMKKWRQERENCRASPTPQVHQPPKREDNKKEEKKEIAVPSIGMETAMREVGQPKLFRSLSEGEIHNLVKPQKRENIRRKAWGAADKNAIPSFANIPLEITASAMEATRVIEPTIKNEVKQSLVNQDKNEPRKGWDNQGKTQFVSKLHDMDLLGTQIPSMTINNIDSKDVPKPGQTITIENKRDVAKPGETIILNKDIPKQGETITLEHSTNKSSIPNIGGNSNKTIVLSVDKNDVENSKRGEVSPIRQEKTLNNENQDGSTDSKKLQKLSSNENKEQEPTSQSANEKLEVTQSTNQGSEKEKLEVDDLEVIEISDNKVETEVSVEDKTNEKTVKNAWSDGVSQKPPESTPEKLSNIEVNKSPTDTQSRHETSGDSSVEMSEEECSFHTPNRSFGLQSGSYDIKEKKLLRTCSLPDLRPAALDDVIEEDEENSEEHANDKQESEVKDVKEEDNREANEDEEEEEDESNEEEEEEVSDAEADADDDDEFDDYESMLESMRNVLGKTAVTMENGQANEQENNEEDEDDDDEWEEERDDEEVSNKNQKNVLQTNGGDRENLFSRIEESRMALENELGMDLFIKVYRHVQMMQDNEDDELEMGTTEISQLLGDKENLYQKILYLVIADSAYSEGNDGTF